MKRVAVTVLAVVVTGVLVAAQGTTDFSGSWSLDKEKSTMPQMGGGPGGPGGPGGGMAESLTIKQTATELTRETGGQRPATRTYKLDGSESVNATPRGDIKSKSKWDGAKLVTESVREMQGPDGPMSITTKEVMSLEADGSLVIESTTTTPMGERKSRLVYKKQ